MGFVETQSLRKVFSSSEPAAGSVAAGEWARTAPGVVLLPVAVGSCWMAWDGQNGKSGFCCVHGSLSGGASQVVPKGCAPSLCRATALIGCAAPRRKGEGEGGAAAVEAAAFAELPLLLSYHCPGAASATLNAPPGSEAGGSWLPEVIVCQCLGRLPGKVF